MKKTFIRKISAVEASEEFILIPKNELGYFPPRKKSFMVIENGSRRKVKVESYRCRCRGPKEPHEHYFLTKSGLQKMDTVEICKVDETSYSLKTKRI
jgi:hypothetical protein